MKKKIITTLIVLAAALLFWAANLLVANLNIPELLKQLHDG